jgi:hypothetical protein
MVFEVSFLPDGAAGGEVRLAVELGTTFQQLKAMAPVRCFHL